MNVIEKDNIFISNILKATDEGRKVYIYGAGSGASMLYTGFRQTGFDKYIYGFIVDDEYFTKGVFLEKPVFKYSELPVQENSLVLNSIRNVKNEKKAMLNNTVDFIDADLMSLWSIDDCYLDYTYFVDNKTAFQETYDLLGDEKSRIVFDAWINSKISGNYLYLENNWSDDQYYPSDLIPFEKVNSFVDCGAYDGDSFLAFINAYIKYTSKKYEGISYLFEADSRNYDLMCNNLKEHESVKLYNIGISDKKGVLSFNEGDSTSSSVSKDGSNYINVDSLDNLIKGAVNFVKMDIEGCEFDAINGMNKHIVNDSPILAICVYHKRSDLIKIPQLINSINSNYSFYLRAHRPYGQELVLYAIPNTMV